MSASALALMSAADGLGPGAGTILLVLFGGAALVGAGVLGTTMVLVGLAFFRRGRPPENPNDEGVDLSDRR